MAFGKLKRSHRQGRRRTPVANPSGISAQGSRSEAHSNRCLRRSPAQIDAPCFPENVQQGDGNPSTCSSLRLTSLFLPKEGIDLTTTGSGPVEIPEWAWIVALSNHLELTVELEYLPGGETLDVPFWMQTGEQAWGFEDDYLSDHLVHFVRLDRIYRLHIRVTPSHGSGITVHRITSVIAKPPDGDSVPLTVEQRFRGDAVAALALFDPARLESQRLQKISPRVGTIEEKYVNVQVFVKFTVGGLLARELEFCKNIFCKVTQPGREFRLYRSLGMIQNKGVVRQPFELD